MEHQSVMIDALLNNHEHMLFAGMGLGKTASTLYAVSEMLSSFEIKGVLIVAPLRVCNLTWPNEIEKWNQFNWMKVANLRTKEGKKAWKNHEAHIYLINYDMLQRFTQDFMVGYDADDIPTDMIVWDEISKAKDPTGKRVNALRRHRHKFERHAGLTGTPTPNSYLDIFAPCRLIDGGRTFGPQQAAFKNRYFESDYMGYKYTIRHWAAEAIEKKLAGVATTLLSEDWLDIPETTVVDYDITLPAAVTKEYKQFKKELLIELEENEIAAPSAAVLVNKLLQLTGGAMYDDERNVHVFHDAKLKQLEKIYKKTKEPLLVIYNYQHERDRILEKFSDAKLFTESGLDDWNNKRIPMWIANAASIGHGLNLQEGSSQLVWFGLTYSRELYDQTNARLARTGQTLPTTIHRILCKGTVDDAVAEALREKGNTQSGLLNALKNIQKLES